MPGNGGYVDTTVLSTNKKANTRLVQFQAQSLSKPIKSKIHVTVKSADYDHDYTIQLKFDESSIKSLSSDSSKKQQVQQNIKNHQKKPKQLIHPPKQNKKKILKLVIQARWDGSLCLSYVQAGFSEKVDHQALTEGSVIF